MAQSTPLDSAPGTARYRNRQLATLVVLTFGLLASAVAPADDPGWVIEVICPDEFPGPPDCFDCQIFGSTVVYDSTADMDWEAYDVQYQWYFGHFDVGEGVNVYNDHYNCEWSPYDIPVKVVAVVSSDVLLAVRIDIDYVTCTGDY